MSRLALQAVIADEFELLAALESTLVEKPADELMPPSGLASPTPESPHCTILPTHLKSARETLDPENPPTGVLVAKRAFSQQLILLRHTSPL